MCASGSLFATGKTIDRREASLCGSVLAWGRGYMVKMKLLLLSSNAAFLGFFGCCCLFIYFFSCGTRGWFTFTHGFWDFHKGVLICG